MSNRPTTVDVLLPYALAVFMPSWRWLLGCAVLVGGPLTSLWIQHWIAASTPGYKEGPGGAIGIGIVLTVTSGFAIGVVVRAITLALEAAGLARKHAFTINAAAFAVVVVAPAVPIALQNWRLRPPSEFAPPLPPVVPRRC